MFCFVFRLLFVCLFVGFKLFLRPLLFTNTETSVSKNVIINLDFGLDFKNVIQNKKTCGLSKTGP